LHYEALPGRRVHHRDRLADLELHGATAYELPAGDADLDEVLADTEEDERRQTLREELLQLKLLDLPVHEQGRVREERRWCGRRRGHDTTETGPRLSGSGRSRRRRRARACRRRRRSGSGRRALDLLHEGILRLELRKRPELTALRRGHAGGLEDDAS